MSRTSRSFAILLLAACSLSHANAQTTNAADDAAWVRAYATDCGSAMKHPCAPSTNGYEGEFSGDARLQPLLRRALPQRESWWVDGYAGSAPVSGLVQTFLGVPGGLSVADGRYVTADGCVPHICTTHGMLWIDTTTKPATVIFVGEDLIAGSQKGESGYHLYVYTSRELATSYYGKRPIGTYAPEFLKSLTHWRDANGSKYDDQKVLLVTTVWPNGRTHDQQWSDFLQPPPSTNNAGAKQ